MARGRIQSSYRALQLQVEMNFSLIRESPGRAGHVRPGSGDSEPEASSTVAPPQAATQGLIRYWLPA